MLRKSLISLMIIVAVSIGVQPQTPPARIASNLQVESKTITEFPLPNPGSGQVDGNRIGRITLDGMITEFPMPSATGSPVNIAVGPDRNIWYTKTGMLGRVTPDGVVTEFAVPGNGGPTGLTAGSDRAPVGRLVDKLWFAQSAGNKIAFISFR